VYHVSLKSVEFLGCDVEDVALDPVEVVDASKVTRKKKKKDQEGGAEESSEPKKTK